MTLLDAFTEMVVAQSSRVLRPYLRFAVNSPANDNRALHDAEPSAPTLAELSNERRGSFLNLLSHDHPISARLQHNHG